MFFNHAANKSNNHGDNGVGRARVRRLLAGGGAAMAAITILAGTASAQAGPTNLVSVCSGVSLPRSAVTDTIAPVAGGVVQPLQDRSNLLLGVLGGALPLVPPLAIDVAGLLADAAAGAPVTLQALNVNGVVVGPTDACDARADSFNLTTPAGVAIGGNRVTGLGAAGQEASAGTIDAVAIGNRAVTDSGAGAAIAIGTGAGVGPGATGSLALGAGATATAANSVALGVGSTATRGTAALGEVSVGAPGAERQVTNVAAGTAATDAANLGQVQAMSAEVGALADRAVQYDGAARDRVTLAGANGTTLANVAAGTVAAGSTEAVNGGQLFATNQAVGANTAAIATLQAGATATNQAVTSNTTAITNLQAGAAATNQAVTNNTTAITNLQTGVANGAVGPVRYANAATPTTPNGGVPSNDVTLVGAAAGAVGLHNVANGRIAAGSTDAVNGGQVAALAAGAANAVSYDVDAAGGRTNTVTLAGGTAAAPVRVANVAAGTAATDAVNLGQLQSGIAGAVGQANAYTDGRLAAVGFDLRRVRRDGYAGTAGALAAAGLPQAYEAGRGMIAIGGGTYMDQSAFAIGFSKAFNDGHTVAKLAGSFDSRGRAGASGGIGYQF